MLQKTFIIKDMTCTTCEKRIENEIKKLIGIKSLSVSYKTSKVTVAFDENKLKVEDIINAIEIAGYSIDTGGKPKLFNQLLGFLGLALLIIVFMKLSNSFNFLPNVNDNISYAMLFFVGILTSFHCVAMCGGINLSQCLRLNSKDKQSKLETLKPSLAYNLGRVIAYTVIGGAIGALGSVFSFSNTTKSLITIIAGVFMLIMALNMLNLFPTLRKLVPTLPPILKQRKSSTPFIVGLLNGLMPCGPLQTMQLYALGTGSMTKGALSMFFFSLGTVPLMFSFGAISSFLSKNFSKNILKLSATFIMALGIIMIGRGLTLSGMTIMSNPNVTTTSTKSLVDKNVQTVTITLKETDYEPIVVQKGIPVKFIIKATEDTLTSCNSSVSIPEYNLQVPLQVGDNVIEFTPTKEGVFPYSCWMGMITSNITVVNNIKTTNSKVNVVKKNTTTFKGSCCNNK